MYLSAYVAELTARGDMGVSFIGPLCTCIQELQKAMSDLDKIGTTPIPSAYSFHLRLTVFAYLFFLPFQLHNYIGWLTIPATAVASIIYLGFLEIGAQIEMPFGYDQSDLSLDEYVLKIGQQLAEVTAVSLCQPKVTWTLMSVPYDYVGAQHHEVESQSAFPALYLPFSASAPR